MAEKNSSAPLLPCPFCGERTQINALGRRWWRMESGHRQDCLLSEVDHTVPQTDEQKQLLIDAWNTRAPQAVAAQAAPAAVAVPDERWCPDVCPITGREFFMWVTHHESGDDVPTYGGPFDSYTIPTQDKDGSFSCERYDHDFGGWKDWENVGLMLVDDQSFVVAPDNPRYYEIEQFATPALPATEDSSAGDLAEASHQTKLLAQALGDCILASGIVRSDLDMSGPELVMFAEDLKELLLARHAAVQAEPVGWMRKTDITELTDSEPETDGWTPLYAAPQAQPQKDSNQ